MTLYEVKPKLKKLLQERNISEDLLSEVLGIPIEEVRSFDEKLSFDITILVGISRVLNVEIEDLFSVTEFCEEC
ncbi:XRE family transcriptional regulator [Bacillus sp. HMF5848]|uniref:helix-turn-helix domain-containing protein n=1 Tax=Bacillus sp. HMF5848 TaxID=2495421 RepID=UPI000F79414F|nr:helix-turn-helix domain-containing protein [Bacillus sp. HMF5848]RSK26659.1 XRE family transcriptional regulator [Bacillus sp. HMF5848]